MSSNNQNQERLQEELDAVIQENAPAGKLEDVEIQRLVQLSKEASYQRSERVPVKTVEAFEPRSLVSIAMAAQRRRESDLRTSVAPDAVVDEGTFDSAALEDDLATKSGKRVAIAADQLDGVEAGALDALPDAAGKMMDDAEAPEDEGSEGDSTEDAPSSTSRVDFEAGHAEGLKEGRRVGFDEGHAKGMEEGCAAGRAEASAQFERTVQAFEAATARLEELTTVDSEALAASVNEAILRLASERAGRAIAEQPDSFADRVEALLASIRTVSGQPSIRLNPADLASIQPLADTREKLRHCNFIADPALAHGDLSVMVGTIGIDDIIAPYEAVAEDVITDSGAISSEDTPEGPPAKTEGVAGESAEATSAPQTVAADVTQPQDGDQDV